MTASVISKSRAGPLAPNLADYEQARASFSWDEARRELDGLPGGRGLNIAHDAVDRHLATPRAAKVAIRFINKKGDIRSVTYAGLGELSSRFANVLKRLGAGKGDRVFVLAGRIPELYIAALGTLKNRSVFCPLFSAFGPEPIRTRLALGRGRVLVTTDSLYRRKVEPLLPSLPDLEHVILVSEQGPATAGRALDFHQLLGEASPRFEIEPTDPEDWALLHFTSEAPPQTDEVDGLGGASRRQSTVGSRELKPSTLLLRALFDLAA